jgi:hypothetical protein
MGLTASPLLRQYRTFHNLAFRELKKALDNSKRFIPGEWPLPSFSPLSRCQGRCADEFHR